MEQRTFLILVYLFIYIHVFTHLNSNHAVLGIQITNQDYLEPLASMFVILRDVRIQ